MHGEQKLDAISRPKEENKCGKCGKLFSNKKALNRHKEKDQQCDSSTEENIHTKNSAKKTVKSRRKPYKGNTEYCSKQQNRIAKDTIEKIVETATTEAVEKKIAEEVNDYSNKVLKKMVEKG